MDGDYSLCSRRDRLLQLLRIHVICALIDIDEHRTRSCVRDCFRRGHKRPRHGDALVARADVSGEQREPKRLSPAANTDGVPRSTEGRKFRLELLHEGTTRKSPALNYLLNGRVYFADERAVL